MNGRNGTQRTTMQELKTAALCLPSKPMRRTADTIDDHDDDVEDKGYDNHHDE
jgi:hypothetical protein